MDITEIKKLVELMEEHDLTKFELEEEAFRIALARGGEEIRMVAPSGAGYAPAAASASSAPASAAAAPEDDGLLEIKAPIVGTFYRAGSPDADAFVSVGQAVEPETVVCIVEAMKVMNEIKAEVKGTIQQILVENASPVVYGQPLFKVKP
jgi:acetyl-CoA carboxylase biotin carboxyl carrier protein